MDGMLPSARNRLTSPGMPVPIGRGAEAVPLFNVRLRGGVLAVTAIEEVEEPAPAGVKPVRRLRLHVHSGLDVAGLINLFYCAQRAHRVEVMSPDGEIYYWYARVADDGADLCVLGVSSGTRGVVDMVIEGDK